MPLAYKTSLRRAFVRIDPSLLYKRPERERSKKPTGVRHCRLCTTSKEESNGNNGSKVITASAVDRPKRLEMTALSSSMERQTAEQVHSSDINVKIQEQTENQRMAL